MRKLLVLLSLFVLGLGTVAYATPTASLTEFIPNNETALGKYPQFNGKQPVNYWYWVSTPGVTVRWDSNEEKYLYYDSGNRGQILITVGNGEGYAKQSMIKTNYPAEDINEFKTPERLYGLPQDYIPKRLGRVGLDGKPDNAHSEYNGEGNKDFIDLLYTNKNIPNYTGGLIDRYKSPEVRNTIAGHIDYWYSILGQTDKFCNMFIENGSETANKLNAKVIDGTVYFVGNVRFTSSQLALCRNNPDTDMVFTSVIVFFKYRDVPLTTYTETTTLPGGGNGGGGGDEGYEPDIETTTADPILSHPVTLYEDVGTRVDDCVVNYKSMSGNIRGKLQAERTMQSDSAKYSKLIKGVISRNTKAYVHNGEQVKNHTNEYTDDDGKIKSTVDDLNMEFNGTDDWVYKNSNGTYGFQVVSESTAKWKMKLSSGDKIYVVDGNNPNNNSIMTSSGTFDVTGTDRSDAVISTVNTEPTITANIDGTMYCDVKHHIRVDFSDFENDIKLSEFKIKNKSTGSYVLQFSDDAEQKLSSNDTVELSNTNASKSLFETDIKFKQTGDYIYEATVVDLATGENYVESSASSTAEGKLIRYTVNSEGSFRVKAVSNGITAVLFCPEKIAVGENANILEASWAINGKDDIDEYSYEITDINGKAIKTTDYFSTISTINKKNFNNDGTLTIKNSTTLTDEGRYLKITPKANAKDKKFRLKLSVTTKSTPKLTDSTYADFTVVDKGDEPPKFDIKIPSIDANGDAGKENRIIKAYAIDRKDVGSLKGIKWSVTNSKGESAKASDNTDAIIGQEDKIGMSILSFQVGTSGDYTITATFKGKTATTTAKVAQDAIPYLGASITSVNGSQDSELKAQKDTSVNIEYKASFISPDNDIVMGNINRKQYETFSDPKLSSMFVGEDTYKGIHPLSDLFNGTTKQATVTFNKGKYAKVSLGSSNGVKGIEIFKEETYFKEDTDTTKLTKSSSEYKKFNEQRESATSSDCIVNFIPTIDLRYVSAMEDTKGNLYKTEIDNSTYGGAKDNKELAVDVNIIRLETDDTIQEIKALKCYTDDTAELKVALLDEYVDTCKVYTNVKKLTSLGGNFDNYKDAVLNYAGDKITFNSSVPGIYRIDANAVDEKGAISDTKSAYIRVYDAPMARLDTNIDLTYNSNNKWNTKEILRFDVTSGLSGVDDEFGDTWMGMDFERDCWTIKPLDNQGKGSILVMEMPKVVEKYDTSIKDKVYDRVDPTNLQEEIDNGTSLFVENDDGSITAKNVPLGGEFRQLTFLKKGRYEITYSGFNAHNKATKNTAVETILVDEDLPPIIEGYTKGRYLRQSDVDENGIKTVTGANMIVSGDTWDNALGNGTGSIRLRSVDGDAIYNVNGNAHYDVNNNDTYSQKIFNFQLGPDKVECIDKNGSVENVALKMVGDNYASTYSSIDSINEENKDGPPNYAHTQGNVEIKQMFSTKGTKDTNVYLTMGCTDVTLIGKYNYELSITESPSKPVIKYIDDNKEKYYKKATKMFSCELDNIEPSAKYEVTEKPKADIVFISNNVTGDKTMYSNYAKDLGTALSSHIDCVVKYYNTNNIKAVYEDNIADMWSVDDINGGNTFKWFDMRPDSDTHSGDYIDVQGVQFPTINSDGSGYPNNYWIRDDTLPYHFNYLKVYEGSKDYLDSISYTNRPTEAQYNAFIEKQKALFDDGHHSFLSKINDPIYKSGIPISEKYGIANSKYYKSEGYELEIGDIYKPMRNIFPGLEYGSAGGDEEITEGTSETTESDNRDGVGITFVRNGGTQGIHWYPEYTSKINYKDKNYWYTYDTGADYTIDERLKNVEDMQIQHSFIIGSKELYNDIYQKRKDNINVVEIVGQSGNTIGYWGVNKTKVGQYNKPILGAILMDSDDKTNTNGKVLTSSALFNEYTGCGDVNGVRKFKKTYKGVDTFIYEVKAKGDTAYSYITEELYNIIKTCNTADKAKDEAVKHRDITYTNDLSRCNVNYVFKAKFNNTDDIYYQTPSGEQIFGDLYTSKSGDKDMYFLSKDGNTKVNLANKNNTEGNLDCLYKYNNETVNAIKAGSFSAQYPLCTGETDYLKSFLAYKGYKWYGDRATEYSDIKLTNGLNGQVTFNKDTSFYMYSIGGNTDYKYNYNGTNKGWYVGTSIFNWGEANKEMLLKFDNGYFTALGMKDLGDDKELTQHDIKIQVNGNKIKVIRDGKLTFNITDNNMLTGNRVAWFYRSAQIDDLYTYKSPRYKDYYIADTVGMAFSDIQITDGCVTPIEDVLDSQQWRDGADRYLILAQETDYPGMDAVSVKEDKENAQNAIIRHRTRFIGLYNTNSEQWLSSIANSVNYGATFNLSEAISNNSNITEYIKKLYESTNKNRTWLLLDNELLWETTYDDPEDDPPLNSDSRFTGNKLEAERWRFTHNEKVLANNIEYQNNLGKFANSGKWIEKPITKFTQTGTYSVNYKRKDNPFSSSGNWNTNYLFHNYRYFSKDYD